MGLVDITITNNQVAELELPASFGVSQKIAAGASRVFTIEPSRLQRLSNENDPLLAIDIEAMIAANRTDLDVEVEDEDTGVEAQTATTYAVTAAKQPVVPGSVTLQVPQDGGGFISLTDVGGKIFDDATEVGTIVYETGVISVTKASIASGTPASTADHLLLSYKTKVIKVEVAANAAVNPDFTSTLAVAADKT